jgi:hypothetical protein
LTDLLDSVLDENSFIRSRDVPFASKLIEDIETKVPIAIAESKEQPVQLLLMLYRTSSVKLQALST